MRRFNAKVQTVRASPPPLTPCGECGYEHNTRACPRCGTARGGKQPRKAPRHFEDRHQAALMRWAAMQQAVYPDLDMLAHVPNGGARNEREGARLKAQGVRPGYPDLLLDCARGGYFGLRIELKATRAELGRAPSVSPEQREWHAKLRAQGYRVEVCEGWEAARDVLLDYLRQPPTRILR